MHQMGSPGGSYAEYAVVWKHTVFRIPDWMEFEEVCFSSSLVLRGLLFWRHRDVG
jgi:NADPH:quinone reductase-like Zn-dependent oxidoreductase